MRILHIISSAAAGGAEIYVRDLSIELVKAKHQVFILFLDRAKESGRDENFERSFLEQLLNSGISYDFIGADARKKPWKGIFFLRNIVNKFLPDIIHCHLYYAVFFSFFIKKSFNVVYTHHNIKIRVNKHIYKLMDFRVSRYIGICLACKTLLEDLTRRPVVRIDNGVSLNRIKRKETNEHTPYENNAKVRLVSVSGLYRQKNLTLLISALSKLADRRFLLNVAGEGAEREKLECLVRELGLEDNVVFLGNVNNVHDLLHDSDVFVMSSSWEGLPIAQIEATLTGLPVIVTNVGGCSEIVHRVCNGIVVDEFDAENYCAALSKIINDVNMRNMFSCNALRYSDDYLIEMSAKKHIDLYNNVMKT
ncbi:glycosyltransferase [Litchfieldella rifensis]|uniref:Glycosyltransferase n=1 Tax=Litchfieldella rifensis TaxID=762643 RepID=A0ABV7LSX9_9GAMM